MLCEERYETLYHKQPEGISFCPYRISPLGAHIDHQWGKINGFAINRGVYIAYAPKQNGVIELESLNFPKRAQFYIHSIEPGKVGDWADHLRGAALMLQEHHPLQVGMSAVIEGTLPTGGISSSAAVIISFLKALCSVNEIHLSEQEIILIAQAAENRYVGVSVGKLDQSCEVLCKKNHLLYLDCKDDSYSLIPTSHDMPPYKFAVIFSGLDRSLKNSKYNLRVDECKSAAYDLLAFAGMDYGKYVDTRLRDVPFEVYDSYKDRLPINFRKRADHYFSEFHRAEEGAKAWEAGDLRRYGKLVFQSGRSSIDNYECGCPELIKLYEILCETDGVYGGRFSGAGFKGCCMAIIDPEKEDAIREQVTEQYTTVFPDLSEKYEFHVCESADGVGSI